MYTILTEITDTLSVPGFQYKNFTHTLEKQTIFICQNVQTLFYIFRIGIPN
jgi:hypothetical protein